MGWAMQRGLRPTPGPLSQASCVIVSGFRAALDLDTYRLSNLIRPQRAERAKPGRGKPKSPHYFSCPCTEAVGIAHKTPRSL